MCAAGSLTGHPMESLRLEKPFVMLKCPQDKPCQGGSKVAGRESREGGGKGFLPSLDTLRAGVILKCLSAAPSLCESCLSLDECEDIQLFLRAWSRAGCRAHGKSC